MVAAGKTRSRGAPARQDPSRGRTTSEPPPRGDGAAAVSHSPRKRRKGIENNHSEAVEDCAAELAANEEM